MSRIPIARKEAILNKMLSPHPPTVSSLSKQEGISEPTLYNWRKQLRQTGRAVPEPDRTSESWSAQTKFAVVVETAALNEAQLAEYCRSKGLYPEQVKAWRETAIASQDEARQALAQGQHQAKGCYGKPDKHTVAAALQHRARSTNRPAIQPRRPTRSGLGT